MNFLAHIFLSGDNDLIKIGNFMADGIRGKQFENYPNEIQKGVILHRAIDTFTDAHSVFRQSTKRLHESYHHYSGVIVDIFYDHFLAKNWEKYSNIKLSEFVTQFYESLSVHYDVLSDKTKRIMPHMIDQNWLYNYRNIEGIKKILTQMDKRMLVDPKMRYSINELEVYYLEFEKEFFAFFQEIQLYSNQKLLEL